MGFCPVAPMHYGGEYWCEYVKRDASAMGEALTRARIDFVKKHTDVSRIVDIGIGGGRFVEDANCRGYDVNDSAITWLRDSNRFCSPYASTVSAITCWDSLEHIDKPWKLLKQVDEFLFVSLPIFDNADHVIRSRHYKPGEHIWYWTHQGFVNWCSDQGFKLLEVSAVESLLGRDGISSYAFKRISDAC